MIEGYDELSDETKLPLEWTARAAEMGLPGQMMQVMGLPGTGKTFLIKLIREFWRAHAGWRSQVVAVGATAARLSEGGITIKAFRLNCRGVRNLPSSLIIIDEVGMCGKKDFEAILKSHSAATIVWIGDPFQFDPVDDEPFIRSRLYRKSWDEGRVACFTLRTFRRYTGKLAGKLERFIRDITARPDGWRRRALAFMSELSMRLGSKNAGKPGVRLVATRAQVRTINEKAAKEMAKARGVGAIKIVTTDPKTRKPVTLSFIVGQTIIVKKNQFNRETGGYSAANGERAILTSIQPGPVKKTSVAEVLYDDGVVIKIPAYSVHQGMYDLPVRSAEGALTVHAMQGATVRTGSIKIDVADMKTFPHLFVAMTRAADPELQLSVSRFDPAMLYDILDKAPAWKFEFAKAHDERVSLQIKAPP